MKVVIKMKRKQSLATYGHLYEKTYPIIEKEMCQYCGYSVGLSSDHVPAITTAQLYVRNPKIKFQLITSCQDCNSRLGAKLLPTFEDRFFYNKEDLLIKNKKKLKVEFRTLLDNSIEYLDSCDQKFNLMLDRIGFGLVKFTELSDDAQKVLEIKIESYGEELGTLIASRFSGLFYQGHEVDYGSGSESTYKIFLQFVNYFNVNDKESFDQCYFEYSELFIKYDIPKSPVKHFLHSWGEIIKDSKFIKIEINFSEELKEYFCTFDEFIEFIIDYKVDDLSTYKTWFDRNCSGLVLSLLLPEKPLEIYSKTWNDIILQVNNSLEE